jgi:hypothetical protein
VVKKALLIGGLAVATLLTAAAAFAQNVPTSRILGTVDAVEGSHLAITSNQGEKYAVTLADNWSVIAVAPGKLADIKPGSYVGAGGVPQSDGTQKAMVVTIFPEQMRGIGEGFRPWDRAPQGTMTNATVAEITEAAGSLLTLRYPGGEQRVLVPDDAQIVMLLPGERAMLAPGAHLATTTTKQPDGTLTAARVNVGKDGFVPQN